MIAPNDVDQAILSRRSVRAFLPTPVPHDLVVHMLAAAARAPSGTNMQPWRVHALAGAARDRFCDAMELAFLGGITDDGAEWDYYPEPLFEPYLARRRKVGWDLYGLLGIARGETEKMQAQVVRNLRYFGAPVGLICTMDRGLNIGSWIDYGMFLQNLCTAARARGLDTCPMAVFAEFPKTVRALLNLTENDVIICGFAIGYEDTSAPANQLRTERVPATEFADFRGFPTSNG